MTTEMTDADLAKEIASLRGEEDVEGWCEENGWDPPRLLATLVERYLTLCLSNDRSPFQVERK
jgi:hypothetical protein